MSFRLSFSPTFSDDDDAAAAAANFEEPKNIYSEEEQSYGRYNALRGMIDRIPMEQLRAYTSIFVFIFTFIYILLKLLAMLKKKRKFILNKD